VEEVRGISKHGLEEWWLRSRKIVEKEMWGNILD
jgi:hypothetical protein